jgi:hypothetical protein
MSNLSLDTMADAIIGKLGTTFTKSKVIDYPDKPEEYKLTGKFAILVTYSGRRFEKSKSPSGILQHNTPIWQVTYVIRGLRSRRSNPGAYDMLDQGRAALASIEFNLGNLSPVKEGFLKYHSGGIWYFGQWWSLPDFFEGDKGYS